MSQHALKTFVGNEKLKSQYEAVFQALEKGTYKVGQTVDLSALDDTMAALDKHSKTSSMFIKTISWFGAGVCAAVTAVDDPTILAGAGAYVFANFINMVGTNSSISQRNGCNKDKEVIFNKAEEIVYTKARQDFIAAQIAKVKTGQLITEDTLAKLVACPLETLQDASDDLTLSVLEARAVLAGRKPVNPQEHELDSKKPAHQKLMISMLEKKDSSLKEEKKIPGLTKFAKNKVNPLVVIDDGDEAATQVRMFKMLGKAVLYKGLYEGVRHLFNDNSLSEAPKTTVIAPFAKVADLSEKLKAYEAQTGWKLALPAVQRTPSI